MTLPTDAAARKAVPIATGFLAYFPDAVAAVAELSRIGNEQHNPGKPLHWDRAKSTDEADCLIRHFMERGTVDADGVRHSTKAAWRAMALLQKEIEVEREKPESMLDVITNYKPDDEIPHPDDPRRFDFLVKKRKEHNADPSTRHGELIKMRDGETATQALARAAVERLAHNVKMR